MNARTLDPALLAWAFASASLWAGYAKGSATPTVARRNLVVAAMLLTSVLITVAALFGLDIGTAQRIAPAALLAAATAWLVKAIAWDPYCEHRPAARRAGAIVAGVLAALGVATVIATRLLDDPEPPVFTYHVEGVCMAGGCAGHKGLRQREEPDPYGAVVGPHLKNEAAVRVTCQARGSAPEGTTSTIWNLLDNGLWVSDGFISTPGNGTFTNRIPRCDATV